MNKKRMGIGFRLLLQVIAFMGVSISYGAAEFDSLWTAYKHAQEHNLHSVEQKTKNAIAMLVEHGDLASVERELAAGMDPNLYLFNKIKVGKIPLLTISVKAGQDAIARALIDAGAVIDFKNELGDTALHVGIAEYIRLKGLNTPEGNAKAQEIKKICLFMVRERGADIYIFNSDKDTVGMMLAPIDTQFKKELERMDDVYRRHHPQKSECIVQ